MGYTASKQMTQLKGAVLEKVVFVFASIGVILLTHSLTWAHWTLPFIHAVGTPVLITIKAVYYWKVKWQYFMVDPCYFVNTLTFIYLWFPAHDNLFRVVFVLANGPVLVAATLYRNSVVYHHHDKMTSCYVHFLPALLTFSIRWFPVSTSRYWFKPFVQETPRFDIVWLYIAPFIFYFLHSVLYCLIVNIVMRPKDPYLTSYGYLAAKFHNLNFLGGPLGTPVLFYGFSWLFCLTSLLPSMLSYCYFPVHCALLTLVFLCILWNGGSYYVHRLSRRVQNLEQADSESRIMNQWTRSPES